MRNRRGDFGLPEFTVGLLYKVIGLILILSIIFLLATRGEAALTYVKSVFGWR